MQSFSQLSLLRVAAQVLLLFVALLISQSPDSCASSAHHQASIAASSTKELHDLSNQEAFWKLKQSFTTAESEDLREFNDEEEADDALLSVVKLLDEKGALVCLGTAITMKHILTAAHCVRNQTKLWIMTPFQKFPPMKQSSNKFCVSYKFLEKSGEYDIAIIKMRSEFYIGDRPLRIALLPQKKLNCTTPAFVAGFDTTDKSSKADLSPKAVQFTPLACPENQENFSRLCLMPVSLKVKPCRGELGGPVMAKEDGQWTVFGITMSNECRTDRVEAQNFMDVYKLRYDILELKDTCNY